MQAIGSGPDSSEGDGTGAPVRLGPRQVLTYLAGLVAVVGVTAWCVAHQIEVGWIAGALAGGVLLIKVSAQFKRWTASLRGPWAAHEEFGTAVGLLAIIYGASLLETASERSSTGLGTTGVALVLLGLIPVAHAIRKDLSERAPSASAADAVPAGLSEAIDAATPGGRADPAAPTMASVVPQRPPDVWAIVRAWTANAVVAGLAIVPALTLIGVHWAIAVILVAVWLASEALRRSIGQARLWPWLGIAALLVAAGSIIVLILFTADSTAKVGVVVTAAVLAFLGAVDVLSAGVRNGRTGQLPLSLLSTRRGPAVLLLVALAMGIVSAVVLWDRLVGVQQYLKVGLLVGLLILGVSFITRGEGFVFAALVGGLIVWCLVDRNEPAPDSLPDHLTHSPTGPYLVALGDSYSSGEGSKHYLPGTNISGGNDCRRSSSAYPARVAVELGLELEFYSCSGARTDQLFQNGQIRRDAVGEPVGQLPQLDNARLSVVQERPPELVLVTIGGNDGFFGKVGRACALPGSCASLDGVLQGNLANVEANAVEALTRVRATFPSSPVVVVPYPEMLYKDHCRSVPLEAAEYAALANFVASLDDHVADAVTRVNATKAADGRDIEFFAAGRNAYLGHQLCDPAARGEAAMNVIRLAPTDGTSLAVRLNPSKWLHNTFHPTPYGHRLMADALVAWLAQTHPDLVPQSAQPAATGSAVPPATTAPVPPSDTKVLTPDDPLASEAAAGGEVCNSKACKEEVDEWIANAAVQALQALLFPALGIFAAGWLTAIAVATQLRSDRAPLRGAVPTVIRP